MIIDSHTHIYEPEFDPDLDLVVARAQDAGVCHCVLPNIDDDSLGRLLDVQKRFPQFCSIAIGLHPTSVDDRWLERLEVLRLALDQNPVVAIGEVGMDLYWDRTYLKQQRLSLEAQIAWALERDLPLILHTREAVMETIECLRRADPAGHSRGIFHSFTGSRSDLEAILALPNYFVGVNGVLTFKNSALPDLLHMVPTDRLLVETDAPYLSPVPKRGQRNEPSYCTYVLARLADLLGLNIKDLGEIVYANTCRLFGLELGIFSEKGSEMERK